MTVPHIDQIWYSCRCHDRVGCYARVRNINPEFSLINKNFSSSKIVGHHRSDPEIALLLSARDVVPDSCERLIHPAAVVRVDRVVVAENLGPLCIDVCYLVVHRAFGVGKCGRWILCHYICVPDVRDGERLLLPEMELERAGLARCSSTVCNLDAPNLVACSILRQTDIMALITELDRELVVYLVEQRLLHLRVEIFSVNPCDDGKVVIARIVVRLQSELACGWRPACEGERGRAPLRPQLRGLNPEEEGVGDHTLRLGPREV